MFILLAFAITVQGAPTGWTCNEDWYNDGDMCNCGCGVWDPDCDRDGWNSEGVVYGCSDNQICDWDTASCVDYYVPTSWTCDYMNERNDMCSYRETHYNMDDGCDCDCGAWDPDCDREGQNTEGNVYGCSDNQICDSSTASCIVSQRGVEERSLLKRRSQQKESKTGLLRELVALLERKVSKPGRSTETKEPKEIPTGWTCHSNWYNDGDMCNCGCGVWDPDCDRNGWNTEGVVYGCSDNQICDWDTASCVDYYVPTSWTCGGIWETNNLCPFRETYYNMDDGCDCDCGAWDPDCDRDGQNTEGNVYGCSDNEICDSSTASCVVPSTDPTSEPTATPTMEPTANPSENWHYNIVATRKECSNNAVYLGNDFSPDACAEAVASHSGCGTLFENHIRSGRCSCVGPGDDCVQRKDADVNRYELVPGVEGRSILKDFEALLERKVSKPGRSIQRKEQKTGTGRGSLFRELEALEALLERKVSKPGRSAQRLYRNKRD